MGNKSGNAIVIDKLSMAYAATSLQFSSRQIDAERVQLSAIMKQLVTDPDCLTGDRAEPYKEVLDLADAFINRVADSTVLLRNEAAKRNEKFNLEVDFKKVDAKAQDSLAKAKAVRAKPLKGQ